MAASDPDAGEEFSFSIKDNPDFGKLTGLDKNIVTYTSNEGFEGTDVFTFTVSDGEDESDEAEVAIKVNVRQRQMLVLIKL
jgi:hypothetical protein